MKSLSKILNIISWPVYLCIGAYLLIAAPMVAGYRPVIVLRGSMEPTYHVASVIYYKSNPYSQYEEGDQLSVNSDL